jgi:hypothetical protein
MNYEEMIRKLHRLGLDNDYDWEGDWQGPGRGAGQ